MNEHQTSLEPNEQEAAAVPGEKPLHILRGHLVELDDYNAMKIRLEQTVAKLTAENSANESSILRLLSEKETLKAELESLRDRVQRLETKLERYKSAAQEAVEHSKQFAEYWSSLLPELDAVTKGATT